MKVGIVTFHRAINYGAALQAYALQTQISKKEDAYILDYRCPYIEKSYYITKKGMIALFRRLVEIIIRSQIVIPIMIKERKFKDFQNKYYHLSKKYSPTNIYDANKIYDIYVSGSDQIWNLKWSNYDCNYFLEFAPDEKKYSYAASIDPNNDNKDLIKEKLSTYQSIIVREMNSVSYIKSLVNDKDVKVGCDPVFFLKKEEWISNFSLVENKKGYVLVYIIAKETYLIDVARKLAKEKNLSLYYLDLIGLTSVPKDFKVIRNAGPIDFLGLILNANYVVTTSFHGLAFSLIFHTPFYYELGKKGDNSNIRLENLVNIFDISSFEIKDDTYSDNTLDWFVIDCVIDKYVDESLKTAIFL